MSTDPKPRCGNCYWWASVDQKRNFIGTCGHREHAGLATDRTETCGDHDPAEAAESYLA